MSTRNTSNGTWSMPSVGQDQDALWGAASTGLPPMGTPGNDVLRGDDGINGFYGMGGNDTIYGYGDYDAIAGGTGNDKLYGGAGKDNFIFESRLNAKTNVDRIMDFKAADDTISLSRSIFKKAGSYGGLKEAAFYAGKKAHDKDDRIIYDKKTGSLYYDADGTGKIAQIKFAILNNKTKITHDDFAIG
ncbi:Ca2+-binding RTX toxin-like protein [Microvirga lupini]|uniref:Ca2+-binding RTX toxin-like protein n=1 Tax=Microvirga lupini TaxID=420324 RepID=A0A7W4YWW0_9HYPH|nr:calcium-binding protein [Microvirga lupini]MBB3019865.1 Ca2+-binding RTX toxin-like protein [Microvirga lupini]